MSQLQAYLPVPYFWEASNLGSTTSYGMVNDKDISGVLALLPKDAVYYFTKASVKRALPEEELCRLAAKAGLQGNCYPDVPAAVTAAQEKSHPEDFIFVGGSSFIVADLLANRDALNLH
jgi:dihydrofolate synthase/folylpolyglutamate synthase